MPEVEQFQNDASNVAIQKSLEKEKKPRTQAQIDATKRMLEARKTKQVEQNSLKAKQMEEEEKIKQSYQKKLEDKIVKKAININKKRVTKKEIIEKLVDTDSETDDYDSPTPTPAPVLKPKTEKVRSKPNPVILNAKPKVMTQQPISNKPESKKDHYVFF